MPLSTAVEAIVRSNNDDLLRRFLSESGEIRIINGALVTDEEESIPAISFSIRGLALRCATTLVQVGVQASQEECAEIMRIAFINDDIEAMDQFLKNTDKSTLTKYLFEVDNLYLFDKTCSFKYTAHCMHCTLLPDTEFDIFQATKRGSGNSVIFIIDKMEADFKIDLTSITEIGGDTVLHVAARSHSRRSEEVINILLSKEPRLLETENEQMRTPLHEAAYCKHQIEWSA